MDSWTLTYDQWNAEKQPLRESLCTLGNGYFATRGAAEEATAGDPHYPGTYLAGGYNRLTSQVAGQTIENEDLVNWPNWLCLGFRGEGGDWFDIAAADVLEFQQSLDLRRGLLVRRVRLRHDDHRETTLVSRRLVHMNNPHLAAIQWTLIPENWSGAIEIRSALDGNASNRGVERYRDLNGRHLEVLETGRVGEEAIYLRVRTSQSHLQMVQAARTEFYLDGEPLELERRTELEHDAAQQRVQIHCQRKQPLRVEKTVAIHTSRDFAISEPLLAARGTLQHAGPFQELLASHALAWRHLWSRADIEIGGPDVWSQLVLRLHIFHLLQTTSFHSIDLDVGVPSRGLHGEAYRGHIFWDELYIFPFLNLRVPDLTRSLLKYRYRRLPAARRLAEQNGYRGAMFPWQSGSSGREESQVLHLNPESGRWIPDNTHRQRHINAAIAYNVWQYFQATNDFDFLSSYGAEMLLEIARFWASIAEYNPDRDRYEIRDVVGPDEFHTQYPDSDSLGLNNNAYTNVMAAWAITTARRALDLLAEDRTAELMEGLRLDGEELQRWNEVAHKMFVPFHRERILSQFEGYDDLHEFPWDRYREKYGDIQRLDRILESEGDSPNRYQASKQADVLMLFYLFSRDELSAIFRDLNYPFDPEMIPENIDYYMSRTSHGSTLSRVVHSWVLARSDRQRSWRLFQNALQSDVTDIQGGTTPEGIHLGAMAGTVDLVQRCYMGIEMRDDVLWLNPCLPEELQSIRLRVRYHGHWLQLHATHDNLTISFEHGWYGPARIGFHDQVHVFAQGDERTFALHYRNRMDSPVPRK